jgi:predicted nucleic acid-binding protein
LILVDTNILIDIASGDPKWSAWSIGAMEQARRDRAPMLTNFVIYAEFSLGFTTSAECDAEIERFGLIFADISKQAAFRASVAFRDYRRNGGARPSPLPDFFIAAHASVLGAPLLTRDIGRYKSYFPEVALIAPP